MKQNFTRITFLFLLFALSFNLQAQHIVEISGPEGVAGFYTGGGAAFYTECITTPIVGEIVAATDGSAMPSEGCEPFTNDVAGKIALVDRGNCFFELKALNAQQAGAIALIICNNLTDSEEGGGPFGMADSEDITDPITIPIVGMSQGACANFRTSLPLTASVSNFFFIPDNDLAVIWGDKSGQGDFNGGNNGWSSVGTTCVGSSSEFNLWQWKEDATANQGAFSGGENQFRMDSPSACNGAMIFDSDFHDNNGEDISIGQGPCPAPQEGSLVSPPIDLSDATGGLALSFYQELRQFQSEYYVGYSIDGGATWIETQINTDIELGAEVSFAESFEETYQIIPLEGAAGVSDLLVRFRMVGNYYYWMIDDVRITEGFKNELIVSDVFYTPASAVQPASQIVHDPFLFSMIATNNGSTEQTDVVFTAEVIGLSLDANDNLVQTLEFVDSAVFASIPVGVDTVLQIENLYTPDLDPGNYVIRYSLTQNGGDENPSNNVELIEFAVTENTFSKDLNGGNDIARRDGIEKHAYANVYGIAADTQEDFVLDNIEFRSFLPEDEGILDGNSINVYLMRVADEIDENFSNFNFTSSDLEAEGHLEFVGSSDNFIFPTGAGSGGGAIFETALENWDDGGPIIKLEPGQRYFAMTEYPVESAHIYQIYSTEIDYTFISALLLYERWFDGFGGQNGFAPIIRMNIALSTAVDEIPLPDGAMNLFPNPATDYIQAQFDLENQLDATVTLATIDGKIIEYRNLPLHKDIVEFKTSNLSEGMYLMRVATEEGTQTKKFLVKRP